MNEIDIGTGKLSCWKGKTDLFDIQEDVDVPPLIKNYNLWLVKLKTPHLLRYFRQIILSLMGFVLTAETALSFGFDFTFTLLILYNMNAYSYAVHI